MFNYLIIIFTLFPIVTYGFAIAPHEIKFLEECQKLELPCDIEKGRMLVKAEGISLGVRNQDGVRSRAENYQEEMNNREQLFQEFIKRHSAPVKGVDALEDDNEVLMKVSFGTEKLDEKGTTFSLIQQYAQTDYGALMIAKIMQDSDQAIKDGYLLEDGTMTSKGKEAIGEGKWEGVFILGKTVGQPTAGRNAVRLPDNMQYYAYKSFPVGEETIDFLAIVHHEFGHTRFSHVPIDNEHIYIEAEVVQNYENPVRYLNTHFYHKGFYQPRVNYFDGKQTINTFTKDVYDGAVCFSQHGPHFYEPIAYETQEDIDGILKVVKYASGNGKKDYRKIPQKLAEPK